MHKTSWSKSKFTALVLLTLSAPVAAEVEVFLGDQKYMANYSGGMKYLGRVDSLTDEQPDPRQPPEHAAPPDSNLKVIYPPGHGPSQNTSESSKPSSSPRDKASRSPQSAPASPPRQEVPSGPSLALDDVRKRPEVKWHRNRLESTRGQAFDRISKHRDRLEEIFAREGVPPELLGIALIESGFDRDAVSPAGALGMWQFTPGIGELYGLETDADYRDPVKSTYAAARYLAELHERFGDWLLAVAAYNTGEIRVLQATKVRSGDQSDTGYWSLQNQLPTETRDYVPAVLAAADMMDS